MSKIDGNAVSQTSASGMTDEEKKSKRRKEYLEDLGFMTLLGTVTREGRIAKWKTHVEQYKKIAAGSRSAGPTAPAPSAPAPVVTIVNPAPASIETPALDVSGIRFVAGHLDILDRKFGILLTFQGFMATIAGLYLSVAFPHPIQSLSPLFIAFGCAWCITAIFCLAGMVWLKWGDLGTASSPVDAEAEQINTLIGVVVKRTAMFRISVGFTVITIVLLAVAVISSRPASATVEVVTSLNRIGPFPEGVACNTDPNLQATIEKTISNIRFDKIKRLYIAGGADVTPIGKSLSNVYVTNIGLAQSRARCVAGWITDLLNPRDIHLEMILSVQESKERTVAGKENDRYVYVSVIENGR